MKKPCVVVSGHSIACDAELVGALQKFAVVIKNSENKKMNSILKETKVDLIVIELSQEYHSEVEVIKNLKSQFPLLEIVIINGNGNKSALIGGFKHGARDAFRKPYKVDLIIERVEALIKMQV